MALLIRHDAQRSLARMPRANRERLVRRLRAITAAPFARHPGTTQLVSMEGAWRLRQGDWRAIYRIVDSDVVVSRVGHRSEVYDA